MKERLLSGRGTGILPVDHGRDAHATEPSGLYLVITDPVAGYVACAEAAVKAGLGLVQLRMKDAPRSEQFRVGRELRAVTRGTATRFIVNDDLDVARAVDADGLHLGQTDLRLDAARRAWSGAAAKIFGLSTHDEAQALAAGAVRPDYIGVGPVYATPTKRRPDPVLGVERAAAIVRAARVPAFAIGGIDRFRLPEVLAAGIRRYAVVRCVCQSPWPLDALRALLDIEGEWLAGRASGSA